MPYCVHCGASAAAGAAVCPACGRPPLAPAASPPPARTGMSKGAIVAIIAAVGCLPAIVVLRIVAALIIPNFLDALQKAKTRRTVADIEQIAEALEERAAAQPAGAARYPDARSIVELAAELAPYAEIPRVDGWQQPLRYSCARAAVGVGCDAYRIVSAGRDGRFEHEDPWHYEEGPFERSRYDSDIVRGHDGYVRWPETP